MSKRTFQFRRANPRIELVVSALVSYVRQWLTGNDCDVTVSEPKRTLDANAAMWGTLTDISKQVDWPHTVAGSWVIDKMGTEPWKAVLTAAFEQETAMAQGVSGGVVMLGARTSQYGKRKMGDFIEFAHAFGSDRGVKWSPKAASELDEARNGWRQSRKPNDFAADAA
jgi:hypothetical protein